MKKVWEFFETMKEFVYVTDIETNELIYMNRMTREAYGFHSVEELRGKKCYEVLQNSGAPCSICNNERLCSNSFEEWRHYNPVLGKHFILKDTLIEEKESGRRYRMEIAIDASGEELQRKKMQDYQDREQIVNEGLRLALRAPSPDKSIEVFLAYMGKTLCGERIYVFEKNASGGDDNTYEWVAENVTPEKENLQNVPAEVCAAWYRNFEQGKNIVIEDLEQIREKEPLQYEILKRQNIHDLVVVPLYDDDRVIAFYGVDNPPLELLDYVSNMLQTMGYFLVSCIKRRNLLRKLHNMSYKDQLTGLGNRFAMESYIKNVKKGESLGTVYCDITGLKHENDTKGHKEGDRLIVRACRCLQKAFGEYGLFRIGGDEILALCKGITEDALTEQVGLLKENMKEKDVVMATGVVWQEDFDGQLDGLLQESERKMYEEKDRYYKESGLKKRI